MKLSQREVRVVAIGVAVALVLVGIGLAIRARNIKQEETLIEEIKLEQGETSITLTREGTLTLRNSDGIFQQQWDEARTREFFAKFEREDLSSFSAYPPDIEGYLLTVVKADGTTKTYYVPSFGISLPEVVEELVETIEELGDSIPPAVPTAVPTSFVFPTVPPTIAPTLPPPIGLTPTPTPIVNGGGNGGQPGGEHTIPFECSFFDSDIKPDIKSETVCTPE